MQIDTLLCTDDYAHINKMIFKKPFTHTRNNHPFGSCSRWKCVRSKTLNMHAASYQDNNWNTSKCVEDKRRGFFNPYLPFSLSVRKILRRLYFLFIGETRCIFVISAFPFKWMLENVRRKNMHLMFR